MFQKRAPLGCVGFESKASTKSISKQPTLGQQNASSTANKKFHALRTKVCIIKRNETEPSKRNNVNTFGQAKTSQFVLKRVCLLWSCAAVLTLNFAALLRSILVTQCSSDYYLMT